MGFLGSDMNDPQTAMNLAIAAGLIRGDVGGALQGGASAYQGAQDGLLKRQLLTEDLSLKRLAEQRAQQTFKMQQDAFYGTGDGGGQQMPGQPSIPPSAGGALGSGTFGMPIGGQQATAPQSNQSNIGAQLEQIRRMAIANVPGAKEQFEILKYKNDPQKQDAGAYYRNPVTGATQFLGDPKVGLSVDGNGNIVRMGGSGNIAGMAGDVAAAQARSNAAFDPVTVTPKGGTSPVMTSRLSVIDRANQAEMQIPPDVQRQRDAESLGPIGQDVKQADAALAEARRRMAPAAQIKGLEEAASAARRDYARRSQTAGVSGVELQSPATAKFNDSVATNEAGQVNEAYTKASAAKQSLPSLWQAQELLKGGTFTGMGSDAKLNVVRALSAIGIPVPESAANSQNFDATMSQIVGKNIKAVVGSNGISNSDVKFVQGMFGQRGQEANAIKYILDKAVESNFRDINGYNGMLPSLQANGGQSMLGEVKPPQAPAGAPTRIKNDADYAALPSGSTFVDPFGKTRRKP